jgi:hypothetical protein
MLLAGSISALGWPNHEASFTTNAKVPALAAEHENWDRNAPANGCLRRPP